MSAGRASLLPMLLTVSGGVLYHIAQKHVPRTVSPFAAVAVAYTAGLAVCLAAGAVFEGARLGAASVRSVNWAVIGVGLGAAAIELGFLLVYRAGWRLSLASVTSNTTVALLLLLVGVFGLGERPSGRNLLGFVLCLIGLALLSSRPK